MHTRRTHNQRPISPAFSLIELLVVIAIIAVVIGIGTSAYLRTVPEAQKRVATEHLRTLAGAIQIYVQEHRDYPQMRFGRIDAGLAPANSTPVAISNDEQSIEALVYQLQYRSDAGKALNNLPQKVFRQNNNATLTEGVETRPLYIVYDPWGNPIQYIRPQELSVPPSTAAQAASYELSAARLNNRVLLISMGPDGVPGSQSNPTNQPTWTDPFDTRVYPNPIALGTGDDIVVLVGATR